jgi:hypothetical protein
MAKRKRTKGQTKNHFTTLVQWAHQDIETICVHNFRVKKNTLWKENV